MSTEIERTEREHQTLKILDVYAGGLIPNDEAPRVDAIATISAGRRNEKGLPQAVREGDGAHIYLHDRTNRAPGLRSILERNDFQNLTISFPYDNPNAFVQQRLALYTATELQVFGDEHQLTAIKAGQWTTHQAGSPEYVALIERCKTTVSVYFALSLWDEDGGSRVIFPDGLGLYRLRFTSRHSLRNLDASIREVQAFTGGRVAGIPFDLALDFREVAGPDGKKRTIPCWTFKVRPPQMINSRTFAPMIRSALAEGQALMLPVPRAESMDSAQTDIIDVDMDEPAQLLERGGRCVSEYWNRLWHATVRGTSLALKEARADFLMASTGGACNSLKLFLETATESEASAMIEAARSTLVELGELTDVIDDEPVPPAKQDAAPRRATAADYVNTYEAAYAEPPAVAPEIHDRLESLKDSLDEVIERHPDPAWQAAGSADEPIVEPIDPSSIDYDGCLALFESHPDLTLKKPLPRLQQSAYRSWFNDHYLPTLKAAQEQER